MYIPIYLVDIFEAQLYKHYYVPTFTNDPLLVKVYPPIPFNLGHLQGISRQK